jgi:HAD superfamily hydrolase (TIGR01450 family)
VSGRLSGASQSLDDFAAASLWIVDLDGVVWLTGEPIGDIAGAVAGLRSRGIRLAFATNNSAPTSRELLARLDRIGVAATAADLATSAGAVASLLQPGQTAHVLAEDGVLEALGDRGVRVVGAGTGSGGLKGKAPDDAVVDAAVVGWSHYFDFDSLAATAAAARTSGRLIGTNEDPTHPTPDGLMPGSGALLAAVATASGVDPQIAGKPHQPMASMMKGKFGFDDGDTSVVMVGDQPRTDGALAQRLGLPFALVDSGVTPASADGFDVPVAARFPDFVSLVDRCLGGGSTADNGS